MLDESELAVIRTFITIIRSYFGVIHTRTLLNFFSYVIFMVSLIIRMSMFVGLTKLYIIMEVSHLQSET